MEVVVEDPRGDDGTRTYEPAHYGFDDTTRMWSLVFRKDGEEVEHKVPTERVVYVETEPEGPGGRRGSRR